MAWEADRKPCIVREHSLQTRMHGVSPHTQCGAWSLAPARPLGGVHHTAVGSSVRGRGLGAGRAAAALPEALIGAPQAKKILGPRSPKSSKSNHFGCRRAISVVGRSATRAFELPRRPRPPDAPADPPAAAARPAASMQCFWHARRATSRLTDCADAHLKNMKCSPLSRWRACVSAQHSAA